MKWLVLFLGVCFCVFGKSYPVREECFAKYIAHTLSHDDKGVSSHPVKALPTIQVYMSSSVPISVWKRLSDEMEGRDAAFVIKGWPGNCGAVADQWHKRLLAAGVHQEILVGATPFDRHGVTRVPTVIYDDKAHFFRAIGDDVSVADVVY